VHVRYRIVSSSHNRYLKLLRLFTNAGQALQMLFAGKMEKEWSSSSLRMFSLLFKKLISLLFDRTFKQRTHLYCTKPTMVHGTFYAGINAKPEWGGGGGGEGGRFEFLALKMFKCLTVGHKTQSNKAKFPTPHSRLNIRGAPSRLSAIYDESEWYNCFII
jgi:hypothetical protein